MLLLAGLGSAHSEEISWDRVAALFSASEAVRAYETGGRRFTDGGAGRLEEGKGTQWTVDENRLLSESGEELPRIAGHNAFWFGWFAFYPTTEIYGR